MSCNSIGSSGTSRQQNDLALNTKQRAVRLYFISVTQPGFEDWRGKAVRDVRGQNFASRVQRHWERNPGKG